MAKRTNVVAKLGRRARAGLGFLFSRRGIPTWKGVIAYVLAYVVIFLRGFENLFGYPLVLTGIVLVTIAGSPGKTVGACVQGTFMALFGVLVGALNFFILAKLGHVIVAQAIVFAIMIYILSLIKGLHIKYLAFSLLAILLTFAGIYTSLLNNGEFVPADLTSYIESYFWGAAIVLFVNICIFPTTSEAGLRKMLVTSLEHIRTFIHLVNKGYVTELSEEERQVRSQLVQSLRADFGFLNQMISETSIEINWSRWSMKDYRQLVLKMRALQATLIAAYSGLLHGEENHSVDTFKNRFLPSSLEDFKRLRRDICLTIGEIIKELAVEPLATECPGYAQFKDIEKQDPVSPVSGVSVEAETDREEVLEAVGRRLREEASDPEHSSISDETVVDSPTTAGKSPTTAANSPIRDTNGDSSVPTPHGNTLFSKTMGAGADGDDGDERDWATYPTKAVKYLRVDFDAFSSKQLDLIVEKLISGGLSNADRRLSVYAPLRSIAEMFGQDHVRGVREALGASNPTLGVQRMPSVQETEKDAEETYGVETDDDRAALVTGQGLVRVYSLLFAMNRLITELQQLHTHVTQTNKGAQRHKRLHIHLWESLNKPHKKTKDEGTPEEELSSQEAIAALEAREYVPKQLNVWQRILRVEKWFRTPMSVYAFKLTAALCVFSILFWAPAPRPWFSNYGMTGALITIVIALSPTLGQSVLTFFFQILGSGLGYIFGMITLEIFRDVGGYRYNPYGITCFCALFAIPFTYLIHEKPKFFTLALLAMNSAGVLIVTEYVYVVHEGVLTFDSPPLRAGKALAALAIALCLVALFQLLILRNPARRTLRKALAHLIEEHLSYLTIFQAYCRAMLPTDLKEVPPKPVLLRVERELKHREVKLQAEIISLAPLIAFASAEPQWDKPFRGDAAQKIVRSNQILLDRWSEARSSLGSSPFQPYITREFVSILSPYRRQSNIIAKSSLYLAASSLASKIPLPLEVPKPGRLSTDMMHDALTLSARFAKSEEGAESVKTGEFTRYWFYLLVITSACKQIENIEEACRAIIGNFEDEIF